MPYGYTEYHIKKGDNPVTIKSHVGVVKQFFAFVTAKYNGDTPDLMMISQIDLWEFLNQQYIDKNQSRLTVEKKQSHIKVFFDYLYKSKQIYADQICKVNYFAKSFSRSAEVGTKQIVNTYEQYLEMEEKVLESKIKVKCKLFMIFYMKGISLHDMYAIEDCNFEELEDGSLELTYCSRLGYDAKLTITDTKEIEVIHNAIEEALEKDTTYLLYSYNKKMDSYGQGSSMSRSNYIKSISSVLKDTPLIADEIRVAYVWYLYFEKDFSTEIIAQMLGRSVVTIVKMRKQSLIRIVELN